MKKIVKMIGGLGNQMFQYAFCLSLLEKGFDAEIDTAQLKTYKLHNGYELEKVFNIGPKIASYEDVKKLSRNRKNEFISRINRKILSPKQTEYIEKASYSFDPEAYKTTNDTYYDGYWQNEKYFTHIRQLILDSFMFKTPLNEQNESILKKILNSKSVSIHIRRGDYLKDKKRNNICNLDYYERAIKHLESEVKNPNYFIFSDDINWCKLNLQLRNAFYIGWNKGPDSFIDMQLLSNCKHNIIANSSFSWWGAWLNKNTNKIILAPKYWYGNIPSKVLCDKWLYI